MRRIGIATDRKGFGVKEELVARIRATGHEVVDFGAHSLNPDDDYPDLHCPAGSSGRGRQGGSLLGDLRQRRRRVGLREQSKRRPRLSHSRSFFCEARHRGRSHKHPFAWRTNRWPGSHLGSRPNLSRRRIQQRPATSSTSASTGRARSPRLNQKGELYEQRQNGSARRQHNPHALD